VAESGARDCCAEEVEERGVFTIGRWRVEYGRARGREETGGKRRLSGWRAARGGGL
jgi:hypothetical protein